VGDMADWAYDQALMVSEEYDFYDAEEAEKIKEREVERMFKPWIATGGNQNSTCIAQKRRN